MDLRVCAPPTAFVVGAILTGAGCATGLPEAAPVARPIFGHMPRDLRGDPRSWVSAGTKGEALLYVSNGNDSAVWVFAYPSGALKGVVYGFRLPEGACVDKLGDVFITDLVYGVIFEYPHGSAKPKAVLVDKPYSNPEDCAVDPTTGNLAVAHVADYNLGVAIYRQAQGAPIFYADPDFFEYSGCGYDSAGNLFIDGIDRSFKLIVAELPKGSSTFTNITLRRLRHKFVNSGGIKWDGKYVAIDDLDYSVIYQVRVQGSIGTVVGSTKFSDGYYTGAFWFPGLQWGQSGRQATRVIGSHGYVGVQYWDYPAGGTSTKMISAGDVLGITVSPPLR